jgi:hypothetical protein
MPGRMKNVDVETVRRLRYFEATYSEIWRAHKRANVICLP